MRMLIADSCRHKMQDLGKRLQSAEEAAENAEAKAALAERHSKAMQETLRVLPVHILGHLYIDAGLKPVLVSRRMKAVC